MRKFLIMAVIGLCLAGCSANEEEKQEPAKITSRRAVPASEAQDSGAKKKGLHQEELEKAGAEFDEKGYMKNGSFSKILNRGGK
jgi:hypothetical protein